MLSLGNLLNILGFCLSSREQRRSGAEQSNFFIFHNWRRNYVDWLWGQDEMHRSEERLIRQILMPRKYLVLILLFLSITIQQLIVLTHTRKIINFFIINSRTFGKDKDYIWYSLSLSSRIHDNDRISFLRKRLKYREVIWVNWQDRTGQNWK